MRGLLFAAVFALATMFAGDAFAQQGNGWHHHGGHWHQHPHRGWHYHNAVGYRPVVQWFPTGTYLGVGPVVVGPNRRYVRMGINFGSYRVQGYSTFNFRTGETRNFPPRR